MNDYVTFDSKKYRTPNKTWKPGITPPTNSRTLANGDYDAIFGPTTLYVFSGELGASVTPGTGFGSPSDLRTSLAKKQKFTFVDHYGNTYSVTAHGPFLERSISPKWDSPSNTVYFQVMLKGTKTS